MLQNQVLCLAYNAAKDELYSGSEDTAIKVWDTQHGRLIRRQEGHRSWVTDLLVAPDIRMLFSCSLDHTIAAWTDRGQRIQVIAPPGHSHLHSVLHTASCIVPG